LLTFATLLYLDFGDFQIPITIFVPNKFVDGGRNIIEAVFRIAFFNVSFGALKQ